MNPSDAAVIDAPAPATEGAPIWSPNPGPQTEAWLCEAMEVFFGGGRGSGKSYWLYGKAIKHLIQHRGRSKMIFFRENVDDLGDLIEKGKSLLEETGLADYISGQSRLFRFKGPFDGASLKMRHLEKLDDLKAYKGHEYTLIGIDEVCDFRVPFENMRDALLACLRNPHGIQGQILYTGNPGGFNHSAVKSYFVDPWPAGRRIIRNEFNQTRCFFQATVRDNPALANDATYRAQLAGIRDPQLRKAWQDGDWTVAMGAMFSDVFSYDKHVLKFSISPNDIPNNWRRYRCFDWGSSKPYCCLWYAIATGEETNSASINKMLGRPFPAGSLIFYREAYGWRPGNARDEGVKLSSSEVAEIIKSVEHYEGERGRVRPGPADTQIFAVLDGTPIYQNFYNAGIHFIPANKAPGSIAAGCELIRNRLVGEEDRPTIYFTRDCTNTIRTLPSLVRDRQDPEILAPRQEDHCFPAETKVFTKRGSVPISEVAVGDKVMTRVGWKTVTRSWKTSTVDTLVQVRVGGEEFRCTEGHPIFVSGEWRRACELMPYDMLTSTNIEVKLCDARKSFSTDALSGGTRNRSALRTDGITSRLRAISYAGLRRFTARYGNQSMGRSQKATRSTIRTGTAGITVSSTWSASPLSSTKPATLIGLQRGTRNTFQKYARWQRNGIGLKRAENGIRATQKRPLQNAYKMEYANAAEKSLFSLDASAEGSFVQTRVKRSIGENRGLMTLIASVPYVEGYSGPAGIQKSNAVLGNAGGNLFPVPVESVSVKECPSTDVFNLTVEGLPEYFIDVGGIPVLVHNCTDCVRYACLAVTVKTATAAEEAREVSSREAFQRELFEDG